MKVSRIRSSIRNKKFITRVFGNEEILRLKKIHNKTNYLSNRFAAKEALSKALGTGFRKGIFWKDLEVSNLISGQPTIIFHGNAKNHLESLMSKKKEASVNLTITDEYPYAHAIVVIESN